MINLFLKSISKGNWRPGTVMIVVAAMLVAVDFLPVAVIGQVVINEVSSGNFSGLTDEDGDFEDWIELYNTGDQPVNLHNWVLTDNSS